MKFQSLVTRTRSYRRFNTNESIDCSILTSLIELARRTPSAANMQPLKYIICCSSEWNEKIFETLSWAGYLKDWPGPDASERPTAYIIILIDKRIKESAGMDVGIAAQTMLLGATSLGFGGCMFGSVLRNKLSKILKLQDNLEIALVLALGKPVEKVVLEHIGEDGSIKYYREPDGSHHVPKRSLNELLIKVLKE